MSSLILKLLKQCRSPSVRYEMALSYYVTTLVMLKEKNKKHKLSQRRRVLRQRFVMNSIPDKEFIYKYRLSRELFDKLCAEITPLLPPKEGPNELDPRIKILAVLNFYAWGRLQNSMGKQFGLLAHQKMSCCIKEVTEALNHSTISQKYIKFPRTKEERDVIKKKFFEKFGFPDVIGCINCNHIAITKPVENDGYYYNNQDYFSFLAQIICDADCNILGVNPKATGGFHCTEAWIDNPISYHLSSLDDTAYLIGNSNYNLDEHLMTPILDDDVTDNSPESRYNDLHKSVYATIDQTIYKLKSRWRCLLTRKELNYDHAMAAKILVACCALHNMCNMAKLEAPELSERDIEEERKRQDEQFQDSCCDDEEYRVKLVQAIEENRLKACGETMEITSGNTEITGTKRMEDTCGNTAEAPCSNTTEAMCGNTMEEATGSNTPEAICGNTMEKATCSNTPEAMKG